MFDQPEVLADVVKPHIRSKATRQELHRLLKEVAKQNLTEGNRKTRLANRSRLRQSIGKKLKAERALGIEMEKAHNEGR